MRNVFSLIKSEQGSQSIKQKDAAQTNVEFVDSSTAARFLSISMRTLQRLRDSGRLAYYQPARKTMYKLQDLQNYMEASLMPAFNATEGV